MFKHLSILWLLLLSLCAQGQTNSDQLFKKFEVATQCYERNSYDSAIQLYQSAIDFAQKNHLDSDYVFTRCFYYTGLCYQDKKQPLQAHNNFYKALLLGRQYRHSIEVSDAVTTINQLHWLITKNDWEFPYMAPATTIAEDVIYQVEKVDSLGKDSVLFTIYGGRYDGIIDSLPGRAYSTYNQKTGRESFISLGNVYITGSTNNRTTAVVKLVNGNKILPHDIVYLRSDVPTNVSHSVFRKLMLNSVFLVNNYKERAYERRYFFNYYDSLLDGEVLVNFKKNVEEIADILKGNTAYQGYRSTDGIFKNETVIPAMSRSTPEHLTLFLNYVNAFPGNYCGNNYRFSETYATWVFSNTPLVKNDITSYLAKRINDSACRVEIVKLLAQINEAHLTDEWLNTGIQAAYTENVKQARSYARLLNNESQVVKKRTHAAWNKYILAICESKNSNIVKADSLLHAALNEFKAAGDKEGELWTNSALDNIKKNKEVSLYVQSGHLMPYILALSANPRYFATAGYDNLIKIWDINQAKEVRTIPAHSDEIFGLSFSKDGRYMISTSRDTTIKVWNAYDYSLLKTIKAKSPQIVAVVTPDSKHLATGGRDSVINMWDIETGKITNVLRKHKGKISDISFDPSDPNTMLSSGTDSMIYQWSLDSLKNTGWFKEPAKILSVKVSPNGKYMTTVTTDTMINVWEYSKYKKWFRQKVSYNNGTYSAEDFSPDGKFLVYPIQGNEMKILDLQKAKYFAYRTDKYFPLESVHFSKDGNFLIEKHAPGGMNKILSFANFDVESAPPNLSEKELKLYTNPAAIVQFSKDDKQLYICSNNITRLDLSTGKPVIIVKASQIMTPDPCLVLSDETLVPIFETKKPIVHIYDHKNKDTVKTIYLDSNDKVRMICFTSDDKRCYLGGDSSVVRGWDMQSGKILFTIRLPLAEDNSPVNMLKADTYRHCIYATVYGSGSIYAINPESGRIKDSMQGYNLAVTKNSLYVTGPKGYLLKYDPTNYKLVKKIKITNKDWGGGITSSPDMTKVIVQSSATDETVLDTRTDKILYSFYDHDFGSAGMHVSHDSKRLATGGFDNRVNIYDLEKGTKIATIYTPMDQEPVISDPKGHYMASKRSLDGIVFNYNNNAYGFEQFDLQFNRPDIILKGLNKADDALVQSYYTAYKKRLQRAGLTEEQVNNEIHLPATTLNDKYAIRPTTTLPDYVLDISCYDSKYKLRSLHVLVNNSPVFGTRGKDVSMQNTATINEKISIPLSAGNNQIKIWCVNEKGVSSLKESFEVLSNYVVKEKPVTYFVGIAVANYKDSSMSLKYSAKDIRDLAKSFRELYPNAIIDTLIDAEATKPNILALKAKLEKTHVNDKVILAVTGHGLLSDSLDFYYGTYDVDFKKPELLGLKYELLEGLLDDIPARQKLLLIDACHSGALDKETLLALKHEEKAEQQKKQKSNTGVNLYAARGGEVENKDAKLDANNTFDLMQNQFADLSNSNGTVVISAAGGLEFAFESAQWNNGVFTYCVRKAIEETEADRDGGNFDGWVSVQEVLNYVSKKVTELTNGNQRPTSRRENLEYDWNVR